jgi:hypothetical protein
MDFAFENVYPGSMGASLGTLAAVDRENQSALAVDGGEAIQATDKAKSYNITMALVSLIVLIVLLQMTR